MVSTQQDSASRLSGSVCSIRRTDTKRSQKLIRHLVLWPLSQISVSHWSCLQPACFSHVTFSSLLPPPTPPPVTFHVCVSSPLSLSDMWEHDLVELVLEVPVSQVSHRNRDMLLRQVGVLLGVLDSDIIVREISAFNERRRVIQRVFHSSLAG